MRTHWIAFVMATLTAAGAADWPSHYTRRKAIAIDRTKVAGTLANFPVLISLTDANLQALAKADGSDILFTAADGVTKLNHELQQYNNATGELVAWVNVPSLSDASDTVLYLYYGHAGAAAQQNAAAVWDASYKGVYHFGNGTAASMADATANGRNGTNTGSPAAVAGKVGGAVSYSGSGQYTTLSATGLPTGASARSIECWVNPQSTGSGWYTAGFDLGNNGVADAAFFFKRNGTDLVAGGAGSAANITVANFFNSVNVWRHLALTYDGATLRLYTDGAANGTKARTLNTSYVGARIAAASSGGGEQWIGHVDEARITSSALSAEWIATEYNNQNAPGTFYSIGAQEITTALPAVTVLNPIPTAIVW
jgi:hypothetical protein